MAPTQDILARCRQGDQHAWSELVDRYCGLVVSVARREQMTPEQCDDVVQLVFTALFADIDRLRDEAALPGWLAVVTRRTCWRTAHAARRIAFELDGECEAIDTTRAAVEQAEAVRWGLNQLSPRCRELLEALFLQDPPESYERLSARLGLPVGSIGPTRRRCLTRLAQYVTIELGEPTRTEP